MEDVQRLIGWGVTCGERCSRTDRVALPSPDLLAVEVDHDGRPELANLPGAHLSMRCEGSLLEQGAVAVVEGRIASAEGSTTRAALNALFRAGAGAVVGRGKNVDGAMDVTRFRILSEVS